MATTAEESGSRGTMRTSAAPARPMRRVQASSASPFVAALSVNKLRIHSEDDDDVDPRFVKVQQVAWEDDILWGIDVDKQRSDDSAMVDEKEDDDSTPSAHETNAHPSHVASSSAAGMSTFKGFTPSSNNQLNPRRVTSAVEAPWMPSTAQEDFDMTRPGHYRWEIHVTSTRTSAPISTSLSATGTERGATELPCPLNMELDSGSWIDAIGWNSTRDMPESKLVLDDRDPSLIFAASDMENTRPTLRIPERKLGAAEIRREEMERQRRKKNDRLIAARTKIECGFGTAEYRKNTDGAGKNNADSRVVGDIGYLHHSLPAIKLSMTKAELSKAKLREFHRPRGKFKINECMVFAAPPVVRTHSVGDDIVVTDIRKNSDLTPVAGGKLILVEYTEQNPPMLSNPGMASRILHYWRPPDHKEGVQMTPPQVKMGKMITLGSHDKPPFVGNVPPSRVVASLNSNLYKVPIFEHKPVAPFTPSSSARSPYTSEYELFLLCRSVVKGKDVDATDSGGAKITLYLFEMPDLYLAGQVEPQVDVPAPNSRSANDFIRPYMLFHIRRLFKKASDGERLKIGDVARVFPNQSGTAIRKRMKEVATFLRGGNDLGWWMKMPASELMCEEELRASIPPESVCLYESMMACHRRLRDIGLTKLFAPTGVKDAINLLLKRLELRKQALSAALVGPLKLERRAKEKAEQDVWKRDSAVRKLEKDIQVARYIHEQLLLTPWSLTNNYVECHLQGNGSGMLQLGGIGDPTGRGEGFSFVRVPQSRAKAKDGEPEGTAGPATDNSAVRTAGAAVTGTSADLRKLKMKEAGDVLRNLGVPDTEVKKLRRWDRIHMIRELTDLANKHGLAGVLRKFARGERKSLAALQQDYQRKCDIIYERQMDVLSSTNVIFSDDDESGDDSDIVDELMDELLGDETFGGDFGDNLKKLGPKNLFAKGGEGFNRSKEALAEREDAIELERLMKEMKEDSSSKEGNRRSDIDVSMLSAQLRASGINEGLTYTATSHSNAASTIHTPSEHRSRASSPMRRLSSGEAPSRAPGRKVLKRTTRVVDENGTESVRIEFVVNDEQVGHFLAKQQHQRRQQKADECKLLRKRKRVVAVEGDASTSSLLDVAKRQKQTSTVK